MQMILLLEINFFGFKFRHKMIMYLKLISKEKISKHSDKCCLVNPVVRDEWLKATLNIPYFTVCFTFLVALTAYWTVILLPQRITPHHKAEMILCNHAKQFFSAQDQKCPFDLDFWSHCNTLRQLFLWSQETWHKHSTPCRSIWFCYD